MNIEMEKSDILDFISISLDFQPILFDFLLFYLFSIQVAYYPEYMAYSRAFINNITINKVITIFDRHQPSIL